MAVITAHGNTENAVAALKAGAFDYVSKPVGLEQLRAMVRVITSYSIHYTKLYDDVAEQRLYLAGRMTHDGAAFRR